MSVVSLNKMNLTFSLVDLNVAAIIERFRDIRILSVGLDTNLAQLLQRFEQSSKITPEFREDLTILLAYLIPPKK